MGIKEALKTWVKGVLNKGSKRSVRIGEIKYQRRIALPNLLARTMCHEDFLDDIYYSILKEKEGAIIDVGVNIGQTLFKMLSLDKNRSYYGFEPQCMPAACVETFLVDNKLENYCILPIALSDRNGIIRIRVRGTDIYSMASPVASIVEGFRPDGFYSYSKYIYAARGDDVIEGLDIESIALIKIDVEGAELEVIRGLTKVIGSYRPFLLFEVLHHYLALTKEQLDRETIQFREARVREMEGIIRDNSYQIYQIDGNISVNKIEKIEPKVVDDLSSTDFIAVPNECESAFCRLLEHRRTITII